MMKIVFYSIFFFILSLKGYTQNLPIGSFLEDHIRYSQLEGKFDSNVSFTVRPILSNNLRIAQKDQDSLFQKIVSNKPSITNGFHFLPFYVYQQINTNHPYGWNDGAMIGAKGFQTLMRGGFFASMGPLSIQIQPEVVFASNDKYPISKYYGSITNGSYTKIFPGQSSVRLNYKGLSLGVSTENIWWGPGINASLIMSNNAPGFSHITFNSTRPIKTAIGKFEWQLIAGLLTTNLNRPYENYFLQSNPNPLSNVGLYNRYINGVVLSWQPKWTPGLFFGMSRVFQQYTTKFNVPEYGFVDTYLPVFGALFKKNIDANEQKKDRDQLISIFTRYLMTKAHAEFYLEYGFNDHAFNMRDFILSTTHASAYLIGGRKILNLPSNKALEFAAEITQMEPSPEYIPRNAGDWYEHNPIYEGYTNENQIMGAGSMKGNNIQTFSTTLISGVKKIGIKLERVQYNSIAMLLKTGQYWADNSIGLFGQNKFKKMVLSANLQFIKSDNYGWEAGIKKFNIHGQLSANYFW